MPYSGLLPSSAAIKQACREPLDAAPREHKAFAVYIFERARAIDAQRRAFMNRDEPPANRATVKNGSRSHHAL